MTTDLDLGTEEEETSSRRRDPELLVMEQILRQLRDLDEEARPRVISYLVARYPEKQT